MFGSVEVDGLEIVEREFSEVNLAVLGVAELDSVVEDAGVVCAHRADVDGLDAADTSVVFYLHSAEVAQGVGHVVAAHGFETLPSESLARNDLAEGAPGAHRHFAERYAVVADGCRVGRGTGGEGCLTNANEPER